MSDLWMPGATRVVPLNAGPGSYVGGPARGVIHTTETKSYTPSTSSYYGHQSWPHATIDETGIYQHYPVNRSARALKNLGGGVETNRWAAVQCEVVWRAGEIRSLPPRTFENLKAWMRWVQSAMDVQPIGARFVGPESKPYGVSAPQRFSAEQWRQFNGWCGHQHVPENCVNVDSLVLGADLEWRPAVDYVAGDELIGFDEQLVEVGSTGGRRFRPSVVERNSPFKSDALRVVTDVGEIITTPNHPWLVRWPYVTRGTRTTWVTSDQLDPQRHEVYFACAPWRREHTHDAGWLAGVLDADGHTQANRNAGAWVGWGQVPGSMLDRFVFEMESRGFTLKQFDRSDHRRSTYRGGPFVDVRVLGGLWEQLRCLGTLHPHRLDLRRAWDGAVVGKTTRRVKVLAIESAGEKWFAGLQTSTRTYIAGGFLMHNSHWDPGALDIAALLEDDTPPIGDGEVEEMWVYTVAEIPGAQFITDGISDVRVPSGEVLTHMTNMGWLKRANNGAPVPLSVHNWLLQNASGGNTPS